MASSTKKMPAKKLPKGIAEKAAGSVMNTRPGPESASIPKAKVVGKNDQPRHQRIEQVSSAYRQCRRA